jgi:hypothetical protein
VTPLWLALPALVVFCGVGAALEQLAGVRARWVPRDAPLDGIAWISHGAALYVAFVVHPGLGVALLALSFLWLRRGLEPSMPDPVPATSSAAVTVALLMVALATLAIALSPPVPIAWDELVWLSRARVGTAGPFALADRALDPRGGLVPSGYPIGAGALSAALSLFADDLRSLTGGAGALVVFSGAVFALVLAESKSVSRRVVFAVIAATPLVWVHLRTGMLDLPVGLLVAALALSLRGAREGDARLTRLALPLAVLLASLKDEGAMYAVVIAIASLLPRSSSRAAGKDGTDLRASILVIVTALSVLGVWRVRLALAGVAAEHHAPAGFSFAAMGPVLRELGRAACDVRSFGGSLAVIVVGAVMLIRKGDDRALAWALAGCILATLAALAIGPDAVRSFAATGTLWPRFLLQLVPLGAVVVGAGWRASIQIAADG